MSATHANVPAEPNAPRSILARTTAEDQGLVKQPVLAPHLEFRHVGEQQTLLVSESFNTLLHGELYRDLLPLLDGRHSQQEIVAALGDSHAFTNILSATVSLAAKGYVVSAEHGLERNRAAYFSALGASPRWAEGRLADSRIRVLGDADRFVRHLQESGVTVARDDARLTVVVCDDYLAARLAEVNRRQLELGEPWMLVRPGGTEPLFGPVFPGDRSGPCWACLAERLRNHREVHNFLRSSAGEDAAFRPHASHPAALEALWGLVAAEVIKWLVLDAAAPIHDCALSMNVVDFASSKHPVAQRPQCSVCGDEALYRPDRPPVPLRLLASPKLHATSGGARSVPPQVTLARYRHLVSPISGVVTWLERTSDDTDPWLHVHWAGSNLGMRSQSLSSLRRSLRSKSAGKGSSGEQSEASALCEAVERYSGALHGEEIRTGKRFADFADGEAIHPDEVQLFSDRQLDDAKRINAKGHPYNVVPPRLDPDAEIDWTPVWSLTHRRHRYLPTSMLYSTAPEARGPCDRIADSNGCAAGNTVAEAVLQGFFELAERDAFAIWWYNRLQVPAVDLASFDDQYLARAPAYYARHERELWLLDVTADMDIPTFVALSRRPDGEAEEIIYGAGAHADPRLAALRAVCELNQCLSWLPRPGDRAGRPEIDDPLALWWWKTAKLADCPWLAPRPDEPARSAERYSVPDTTDTLEDVERCQALVEARGMELLVLDQTRPDIGMPVVRVIVPGMRHFWARFAPGRLYDVPVNMGHRSRPLEEADLNPAPVIA